MHTRTATAAAAVLALTLAGCTTDDTPTVDGTPSTAKYTASSTASALTPQQRASAAASAGLPPLPDPAARSAYIADLTAIDPDIVHDRPDAMVYRGRNQCRSIKDGQSHERLLATTNYRFTSPAKPNGFGTDTAARILAVVKKHLCPDF